MTDPLVLRTSVGKHAHVQPLRDGRVRSERVSLEFRDYEPLPKAFRTMVRGDELDVSEMAVVTHLLAHHYGKPITGIAIPLWSRLPHTNLVSPADSSIAGPLDLQGSKVGVRAYAQTSGVWVRGVLQSEYGVDLNSIIWLTMEDAHLEEYDDPAIAVRNQSSSGLRQLMMAGELSAIMGEREVDPSGIRSVIPEAETAAKAWIARTGIYPINHILTVRTPILEAHPWLAQELMEMFDEARRIAEADGAAAPPAYGLEANRRSLQLAFDFSAQQLITPRVYDVSELFHPI
ncbi:phosphate ABC transporter substrate-binding protein [Neorhizobium sp. P12A]|uniref:phosphate ABC transporter substrate-binding protein n=1 Tax=Neorhizobium sp. P12A TaxID=2268027 RepID=UPI0011EE2E68|nr:phosphate ABC transporter substrate-binding protein [Neorhizobium sp. P12A]